MANPVPSVVEFAMVSGDSKAIQVQVMSEDGSAFALDDIVTARYALARGYDQIAAPDLAHDLVDGGVVLSQTGANWFFSVILAPTDTAGISGRMVHEAEIVLNSGRVITLFQGRVEIKPDLNRA